MANPPSFYARVFALAFAGALAWALWRVLQPFLPSLLWALLLAFLLFPVNRWLRERWRGRRGAAALALTFAVIVGVVVPAGLLATAFVRQGSDLLSRLTRFADQYKIVRPSDVLRIPMVERMLEQVQDRVPVTTEQVQAWLVQSLRSVVALLVASGRSIFVGALGWVVACLLTLFLLYFFFRDGDGFAARMAGLVPLEESHKRRLIAHLAAVVRAVVLGSLVTALVQGGLLGVAFAVSGLDSPVVFGVLAAACSLIPIGGTALVWIPAALLLVAQGRWGWAVFLVLWGALVVGTADNVLRPLLISGRAKISTLPVFLGVLGGLAAFGMIGMFLGPVLIALALELMRFAEEGPLPSPAENGSAAGTPVL